MYFSKKRFITIDFENEYTHTHTPKCICASVMPIASQPYVHQHRHIIAFFRSCTPHWKNKPQTCQGSENQSTSLSFSSFAHHLHSSPNRLMLVLPMESGIFPHFNNWRFQFKCLSPSLSLFHSLCGHIPLLFSSTY